MSSLVNVMEKPILLKKGEGRWVCAGITEVARIDSRGSRDGMLWKIYCPMLETLLGRWGDHPPLRIRQRKRNGLKGESEGFIVPLAVQGQHNPGRGKEPCFVHATKERRIRGLPCR
jgi:hypothetical protein